MIIILGMQIQDVYRVIFALFNFRVFAILIFANCYAYVCLFGNLFFAFTSSICEIREN